MMCRPALPRASRSPVRPWAGGRPAARAPLRLRAATAAWVVFSGLAPAQIVINEIHYAPDVDSENVEFIELYNAGAASVSLAGWAFTEGVAYAFPAGASLAPDGYLVVSEDPAEFQAKFGFQPYGPWDGKLSNEGEEIVLRDETGAVADRVDYQLGFPWPTVGDAPGLSIELVNPAFDNDLAGNWRSARVGTDADDFVSFGDTWRFLLGLAEASTPVDAWRAPGFADAGWDAGAAPIGYGEPDILTPLPTSTSAGYTTVYLRKTFAVANPDAIGQLDLHLVVDDGAVAWINGVEIGRINAPDGELAHDAVATNVGERRTLQVAVPNPESILLPGTNVLAVHLLNRGMGLNSTDILIDGSLVGNAGAGGGFGPTPGAPNAAFQANLPPRLRQVEHSPRQPASGQPVLITAKATDPDGVAGLTLQYQLVDPGNYIERHDESYETSWLSLPMVDTGLDGDAVAGDDVYTAVLPAGEQIHRRLVRYRITATDGLGRTVQVPYPDDPQPNFAYFVYDGVPAWQGAVRPGQTPVQTVPGEEMGRLPAYHLIARQSDIEDCTWWSRYAGDAYLWTGTLVYDGTVYDHVQFRARGGTWRYAMVKNMWKFRFLRGHEFQARDDWGRPYPRAWRRLNLGASIQQGDFGHRGEQGMFESVGFRMFNLAGVEAPSTSFVTLRIIDDAQEAATDQYESDFWGLYLAVEQIDGRFLDAHDLPDGNIYKMEGGTGTGGGDLKHQGEDQVGDSSDLVAFRNQLNSGLSESWWRANLDVARYSSYYAIVQAIHHYDICCGKNYYYYFNAATGLMQVHPWDLDLSWADNMYNAGDGGTDPDIFDAGQIFQVPGIRIELQNRVRELLDLLCNPDQGWQLLDEYAALLTGTSGGPTIVDADRAMWDYNPKMQSSSGYSTSPTKALTGRFYQFSTDGQTTFLSYLAAHGLTGPIEGSFAAGVRKMKYYLQYRSGSTSYPSGTALANWAADAQIPATPTVTYTGPEGFPLGTLSFRATNYSGGNPFAALRWRLAEVAPAGAPALDPHEPRPYEIEARWESGDVTDPAMRDVLIPPDAVRAGSTYRVRCRYRDATGRWSHWSPPVEFATREPLSAPQLLAHLRISEVMFHAPDGSTYDFVELHNTSPDLTLDLAGAKFTQGIDYTFPNGAALEPGQYLLVIENPDAAGFRAYYGLDAGIPVLGPYTGSLSNGGEQLTLRTAAGGQDIASFAYGDGRGWPPPTDGSGHSLVPLRLDEQAGGALDYPGHWRASTYIGGSPGAADPPAPDAVTLNEIAAHTDYEAPPPLDSNDWIELHNPGPAAFTFGPDWYLSDDGAADQLAKWMIPAEITIPAGGFVTFDEQTGFHNPPTAGFGINKAGEQVFLSYLPGTGEDRVVDSVRFAGQEVDWTLGRWPDGRGSWYPLQPPTRDDENSTPNPRVIVNELMYHPPDTNGVANTRDEYIELRNPTDTAVALFNEIGAWRLDGGVAFTLPAGVSLPAGGHVLVVSFDPADAAAATGFRAAYGLPAPGPTLWGPYTGRLANRTDRVTLERPQAPDAPGDGVSWVTVDEVIYADQAPWPETADGLGLSLHRIDPVRHGSDPGNWIATSPSPGESQATGTPPTITTHPTPANRTVDSGTAVTYTVVASGDVPLTYQWRRDGIILPSATNDTLHIPSTQPSDSGAYAVLVVNHAGSALSDTVHLQVITPPQILSQPQSATVPPGATVTFEVVATGTGPLSYAWQFNGTPIIGPTQPTLLIANVQESAVGAYTVTVTDDNASLVSEPAYLKLLIPPEVLVPPFDRAVAPGTPVTFTVTTRGITPMTYLWKRDGQPVATHVLNSNTGAFTIPSVQPADTGTYTVVLTNDALGPPGVESPGALLTILSDRDGDGMPDGWETDHQLDPDDPEDADLDPDGDGFTNRQEYRANTHPRDAASALRIHALLTDLTSQGSIQLTFPAAPERAYTVEFRNTLAPTPWQPLLTIPTALTNRSVDVSDIPPATVSNRFYRVAIPAIPSP